jgi:hypothetical protein
MCASYCRPLFTFPFVALSVLFIGTPVFPRCERETGGDSWLVDGGGTLLSPDLRGATASNAVSPIGF